MPERLTRLEMFIRENKLKPMKLAREAGIARQHLLRIRKGIASPSVNVAMRIRDACGRLLFRTVGIAEVFELD